jgi:two-component system phosphate regulon response regulator PhoB
LLRASLAACGYKVVAVESSEQALCYTRTWQPDLVILDVLLSGMVGLESCRMIRAATAAPILVLSAHTEERIKARVLNLGADNCPTKPFGVDELHARVRELLGRAEAISAMPETLTAGAFVVDQDR